MPPQRNMAAASWWVVGRTGHAKHQTYEQENASVPQVTPRVWPVWAAGIHIRRGMHFCGVIYARCDCQSGRWSARPASGWGGSYFHSPGHGGCYRSNPITGGCSCPSGFTAYLGYSISVGGCYPCSLYQCAPN